MKVGFIAVWTALAVVGGVARAAADDGRIVIEAYDGERPDDAGPALERIYGELARHGYAQRDALAASIVKQISRDGGLLTAGQVVDAQKEVDDAFQRFIDGDYPAAITAASSALSLYAAAPGQLAREPALRTLRWKALLIAARSSEAIDKGDDAFALMAEAIRSFPDHTVNTAEFDPRVGALQRKVKEALTKQGTGTLSVKVDDPSAVIFIDEQFAGTGAAELTRVFPGRYRVYVTQGERRGRVHEVDIAPGGAATMNVPWHLDGALHTGGGNLALELAKGASSDAQLAVAIQLGRALGAKKVVVLSLRPIDGHRALIGYAITVESQNRVFGGVQIEPVAPAPDTIARFASLLAGDKDVSPTGLITVEPIWTPPPHHAHPLGPRRSVALGIGGAALLSGVAALGFELSSRSTYDESTREVDNTRQDALYDSANRKYKLAQGFAIGAAACAIGAGVLWLSGGVSDERPSVVIAPTPDGASFVVEGSF